jgi:hypothetical protein
MYVVFTLHRCEHTKKDSLKKKQIVKNEIFVFPRQRWDTVSGTPNAIKRTIFVTVNTDLHRCSTEGSGKYDGFWEEGSTYRVPFTLLQRTSYKKQVSRGRIFMSEDFHV